MLHAVLLKSTYCAHYYAQEQGLLSVYMLYNFTCSRQLIFIKTVLLECIDDNALSYDDRSIRVYRSFTIFHKLLLLAQVTYNQVQPFQISTVKSVSVQIY